VHSNPGEALCDGDQSLMPEMFEDLAESLNSILPALGKNMVGKE